MALYDQIQELRAELSACCSKKEIRQIRRELAAAVAEMARVTMALDTEMTVF
ncbi:MAG: hypothetical protein ACTHP8_09140 [Bosea sp. (in: a-proteobacteria)]|uniref:hypothetical protein n=1 Tax=Bosea sp. (in: a-proteobacteria) TaxID=1871050 RepID=UPI003F7C26A0